MSNNIKYYISDSELDNVKKSLEILSNKRLVTKFAKSAGVPQPTLSRILSGKSDLEYCTLSVYNKIVSNLDTFLAEYEEK